MGLFTDIISVVISNVPIERLVGKPARLKYLKELRDQLPSAEEQEATEEAVKEETSTGVSDQQTLLYQLDLLIDDTLHLETEHLPNKGRIAGLPCDCISKAARELRRHARETIPIAARQGKHDALYSEASLWAMHMMEIGTLDAVASGKHDEEYLREAGTASRFRKEFERLHNQVKSEVKSEGKSQVKLGKSEEQAQKSEEGCPECATLEERRARIGKRKATE